jgi:glycosyltransferase involved in cell wall biosynthesis
MTQGDVEGDVMPSLSIVVPAYNEEANLAPTVLAAEAVFRDIDTESLEWVLVDDGSVDGTWPEITRLADTVPGVVPARHAVNRGLGAAIWTGMAQVSSDWCTWMPADGQFKPQAFVDMWHLADASDLVILIRDEIKRAWWRRIPSLAVHGLMQVGIDFDLYGYCGIFMARRAIVQDVPLYCTTGVQNFAVVLHSHRDGRHIRRVSAVIQPRISGKSKVANPSTMLKSLFEIVRLRLSIASSARRNPAKEESGA